jgi:serine/threonine-protein kinase ULK/ATG1
MDLSTVAPEVLEKKEFNARADIFTLGSLFYELVFGVPPFEGNNL